ncbi:hypothetical protein AKJ09_09227 [Labilithrix luteola]|uniref:Uncharacterized protein n=1 Tax=Labilithrix luteola TaxID=1391654 RepID=A0A0K1Q9Z4_9BACT|nr:hypothetical protein [Labilithrix luteola]AKV02564.1 hypothetical protein AKJ09_09227 [Labilithrix luteola]
MRRVITLTALSTLTALLTSLAAVACSADAADESASSDEAYRVKPDGSDVPGTLNVVLPDGVTGVRPATVQVDLSAATPLGTPITQVAIGTRTFRLESTDGVTTVKQTRTADIVSGQTTTIKAAVLGVKATGGPRTFGLGDLPCTYTHGLLQSPNQTGRYECYSNLKDDGSTLVPIIEGQYVYTFGLADGVTFKIAPGETKIVALTDYSSRKVAHLKAPARELPDVTSNSGPPAKQWRIYSGGTVNTPNAIIDAADGSELDIGLMAEYANNNRHNYSIQAHGWHNDVALPMGQLGAGPLNVTFGRLDVDDVSVNGGAQTYRGKYNVVPVDANNRAIGEKLMFDDAPTGTGIDVLPGRYQVTITYNTSESGLKSDIQYVDIPW